MLLGIVIAGLLRQQLTSWEFLNGYLVPARFGGEVAIVDHIYNLLQSAASAVRFRVTSYEGFLDSVKGERPLGERLPAADPEGDGRTNLEDFTFALVPSGAGSAAMTELRVKSYGGQQFAAFSYRQPLNVKRVEFLIQTSPDMQTWTAATNIQAAGGVDMGTYIKRRVAIPITASDKRTFVRVQVQLVE